MLRRLTILVLAMILSIYTLSFAEITKKDLDDAYNKGVQVGKAQCSPTGGTRGLPIYGLIGGTPKGNIVLGGTKGDQHDPGSPGTRGYEFSSWMLYNQINSPLITDTVRKAIKDGENIQITGFAFNNDKIMPGRGTLSFSSSGSAMFSFEGEQLEETFKKPEAKDAKVNIQALRGLGVSNGFIVEQLIVK